VLAVILDGLKKTRAYGKCSFLINNYGKYNMDARYRTDYPGEFVILESKWSGGKKQEIREWIPNSINNQHISGRAACIGSSVDQDTFDYTRLARHRGGLLSSKKLQTYGVGEIALEMRLDFTVETRTDELAVIKESSYQQDSVVYTTAKNCIKNPGDFYLIPHRPQIPDLATVVYLAAFDGHLEIFLLGYHKETPGGRNSWVNDVANIFKTYPVNFYLVGESTSMPDEWLDCANVRTMSYRDWISYCDVSQ